MLYLVRMINFVFQKSSQTSKQTDVIKLSGEDSMVEKHSSERTTKQPENIDLSVKDDGQDGNTVILRNIPGEVTKVESQVSLTSVTEEVDNLAMDEETDRGNR